MEMEEIRIKKVIDGEVRIIYKDLVVVFRLENRGVKEVARYKEASSVVYLIDSDEVTIPPSSYREMVKIASRILWDQYDWKKMRLDGCPKDFNCFD